MFHRQRPHLIPPLPVFTLAPAGGVTVVILAAEQLRRYDSPGRLVLVGGVFFLGAAAEEEGECLLDVGGVGLGEDLLGVGCGWGGGGGGGGGVGGGEWLRGWR